MNKEFHLYFLVFLIIFPSQADNLQKGSESASVAFTFNSEKESEPPSCRILKLFRNESSCQQQRTNLIQSQIEVRTS